jgi:signal transduction histidine kinase
MSQSSILIVDDTPTNLKVLFELLDAAGYRVSVAKSGEKALEKLALAMPDLILLDVMMPGIDGFETCRQIKETAQTQDIPIIFMTALSDTEHKVKGLNLGAVDYITKPIAQEEVLARVKVHLQLRQAQLRLIQEEKLSSLGRLVAGIAHEINNPVNFISGNLCHLRIALTHLFNLIELYEKYCLDLPAEIADFYEEIDLDFLREDLPKMLTSMEIGSQRIQEIVRSLRVFSHLDESGRKKFDVQQGIESTLMLLAHRCKVAPQRIPVQIERRYGGLPLLNGYPSQLNQVFLNLLDNAIDAIDARYSQADAPTAAPTITLTTQYQPAEQHIRIVIQDNGTGLPPEMQDKIFDPFFTTKAVGKGTGLGLAIARQVVEEQHGGTLTYDSTPDAGTCFTINLPCLDEH